MRHGITPVVAMVLLLMMTVAAAGGAYVWFSSIMEEQQKEAAQRLETEMTVKDVRCRGGEIRLSLHNSGDRDISADDADLFLYRDDDLLNQTTVSLQGADFTTSGGFDSFTTDMHTPMRQGNQYRVSLELSDAASVTGTCDAGPSRSCRTIHSTGVEDNGRYHIDPDGIDGESSFPVFCNMTSNGGGWTRLYLRPETDAKGLPFGGNSLQWARSSEWNFGMGRRWFQRPGDHRCTVYAIGNATRSSYKGAETLWDYYDAEGTPITPSQISALSNSVKDGTFYWGEIYVDDVDGPFPDGGDGDTTFGQNSFNMEIDPSAAHSPTGGGPIVLWFSNATDMDYGTTHALGNDRDSGEDGVFGPARWKTVHANSIPRFMGGKVDNDQTLYSTFDNGCERQAGSTLEFENPYFYVR